MERSGLYRGDDFGNVPTQDGSRIQDAVDDMNDAVGGLLVLANDRVAVDGEHLGGQRTMKNSATRFAFDHFTPLEYLLMRSRFPLYRVGTVWSAWKVSLVILRSEM